MSAHNVLRDVFLAPLLPDPGASGTIRVGDQSPVCCNLVSAAAETRTLAVPSRAGAIISIGMKTDGGDITLTVTGGYNEAGSTTFTFSDPGQFAVFESFDVGGTITWRKISDYNAGNAANPVTGVAAGYKLARGEIALDGSNPTPVATGLSTIVSAQATLKRTTALSSGTALVTVDFTGSDGTLNLYAWVVAGTASTGTETVEWIAIGT